ncbi:HEPN domain-containing protein [Apilactobacillus quenuiae]|uniref:HEPN domain-containing protein n=1 Tax=Apilactobacillus quenuiae TaxID=2008377 RepID=UPI000D01E5EE|nr:HEPN domain-containing protein [Apilactobacillus quenuiae]
MNKDTKIKLKKEIFDLLYYIDKHQNKIYEDNPLNIFSGTKGYMDYSDEILDRIIKVIIKDNELKKIFSKDDLSKEIINLIYKDRIDNKSNESIVNHLIELIGSKPKYYSCIIPVHGIDINKKLDLGIVTIYPIIKKEEVFKNNFSINAQNLLKNAETFALIKVKAALPNKAIEIASKEIDHTLNILKFVSNNDTKMLFSIGIGANAENNISKEFIIIDDNNNESVSYKSNYYPMNLNINQLKDYKDYISKMIDIQKRIFYSQSPKRDVPAIERYLFHANNLVAEGLYENTFEKQMSKFITAVESLLGKKGEGISDKISEKAALFLGHSMENRMSIYNTMRHLYNKRSILTHGDSTDLNYYDIYYLLKISKELCMFFFDNIEKFIDIKEPKEKIRTDALEIKFGNSGLNDE